MRNRKGFGVHSPFAYSLITQVIGEHNPYYSYKEIKMLKGKFFSYSDIVQSKLRIKRPSLKKMYLLYRLVNRFQPRCVLEVNNNGGLSSVAMALVDSSIHVLSLCENEFVKNYTLQVMEKSSPVNIDVAMADSGKGMRSLLTGESADFILLHAGFEMYNVDRMYREIINIINPHSVIVIEGIHSNKQSLALWNKLKSDERIRVTMDLLDIGLCFCNEKLFKQHYKVSF